MRKRFKLAAGLAVGALLVLAPSLEAQQKQSMKMPMPFGSAQDVKFAEHLWKALGKPD